MDETDLSGNTQDEYIFFSGQRIARRDVSSTGATVGLHYYFTDHLRTHAVVETVTANGGTPAEWYAANAIDQVKIREIQLITTP